MTMLERASEVRVTPDNAEQESWNLQRGQVTVQLAQLQQSLQRATEDAETERAGLLAELNNVHQQLSQVARPQEGWQQLVDDRAKLQARVQDLEQRWMAREAAVAQERALWQRYADGLATAEPLLEEPASPPAPIAAATSSVRTAPETPRDSAIAVREPWTSPRRLVLLLTVAASLLPLAAIVRGVVALLAGSGAYAGVSWIGLSSAFAALAMGTIFCAYSVKYYVATGVVLLGSLAVGRNGNGNGNGHGNGKAHGALSRIQHRGNGNGNGHGNGNGNGHPNGNGNGNGTDIRNDLGYEPFISVHIASYNEKRVIERLLECCAAFEYRNYEVILVDDSTDESVDILARWQGRPGFRIIHRTSRDGFKGGALQEALRYTDPRAEYVVIFDADSMPFPDSLQRFLTYFYKRHNGDPLKKRDEVGAVQSYQWHVLNKSESWLTEAVRTEYAGSYMVERPYQEALGSLKMIAGTAYMIRADLLRQLGWGRSLTEDWELTLRLYGLGYKVVYTPYAETPAECVSTFSRFARQRMRWAEGHTFNVRKHFWSILRSAQLNLTEKVEFVFYSTYYLQAAFFLLGNLAWLVAELVFRVHVPQWTALLGWSLLFTNLLALPLMNVSGLVLEAAPRKDYGGVLAALATSFLVVPFQAYAALKGLIEKEEGPWFRTPKTGHITDPISHLKGLLRLRKWLKGPGRNGNGKGHHIEPSAPPAPQRPARRLAWIVSAAMLIALAGIGVNALHAPVVEAAGTSFYLHNGGPSTPSFVRSASATETAPSTSITVNIPSDSGDRLFAMLAWNALRVTATV